MAQDLPSNNGKNTYDPTTQGMKRYAQFIDDNRGGGGGSGTDNYNDLSGKPKINDIVLAGELSSAQLGLASSYAAEVLATMPATPRAKQTVMFVGEETADFVPGHIYRYSGTAWVEVYAPAEGGEIPTITNEEIDSLFE